MTTTNRVQVFCMDESHARPTHPMTGEPIPARGLKSAPAQQVASSPTRVFGDASFGIRAVEISSQTALTFTQAQQALLTLCSPEERKALGFSESRPGITPENLKIAQQANPRLFGVSPQATLPPDPWQRIEAKAVTFAERHGVSHEQAMQNVLEAEPDLYLDYLQGQPTHQFSSTSKDSSSGSRAQRLAEERRTKKPGLTIDQALVEIYGENPDLYDAQQKG